MSAAASSMPAAAPRVGIGFRHEIGSGILERIDGFDCLEIVTDQFVRRPKSVLAKLREHVPVLPHGVGLSLGSFLPPDRAYLKELREVCAIVEAPFYGEHLSLNLSPGIDVGHLAPVPTGEESLAVVQRNVHDVQEFLGVPLCIENITYGFNIGVGSGLEQADMLAELVRTTGCSLLLDVANLHINASNHGYPPEAFFARLPQAAIRQIHLAGGVKQRGGRLVDSHNRAVDADVWTLYAALMRSVEPEFVVIERDSDFPAVDDLVDEVALARSLAVRSRHAVAA